VSRLETDLAQHLRASARSVSDADVEQVVRATVSSLDRSRTHHLTNLAVATALVLVGLVTFVALETRGPVRQGPTPGKAVALPDEVLNLTNGMEIQPFQLRDRKLLEPYRASSVAPGVELSLDTGPTCSNSTKIDVVDISTGKPLRPMVILPGCYAVVGTPPLVLPDGTVFLSHWRYTTAQPLTPEGSPQTTAELVDTARYDWRLGKIVKAYSGIDLQGPIDLRVSRDGQRLYELSLTVASVGCAAQSCPENLSVQYIDLGTGHVLNRIDLGRWAFQGYEDIGGRLELSADGSSLFVNALDHLEILDALTGSRVSEVSLPAAPSTASAGLWNLTDLSNADAKELQSASTIAVDPKGHWIAVLGFRPNSVKGTTGTRLGIWLVSLDGKPHAVGHYHGNDLFKNIKSSLDGSVVYLLEQAGGGRYLLVLDPKTGKDLSEILICPASCGGFDTIFSVVPRS
jgi:hypothetical protein